MRSIVQAMAWEFWRKMQGRLILHLAVIGLAADLVLAVLALLWVAAGFSWNQRLLLTEGDLTTAAPSFFPILLWCEMILSCYAVVQCQCEGTAERWGFPRRFYPLPAPTWALVAQRMLIASAVVAVAHIAIFAPFNYLIGVEIVPVLAPALFLAGAAAIAQAVAWSLTGFPNIRRAALIVLAFPLLVLWHDILRAQGRFDPTTGTWLSPLLAQWLLIAALTPVAYLAALAGVARDRRGGSLGMPTVREWIERVRDLMPSRSKAFASPEGAQFWYEWRRCGGWAPVVGAILGSLVMMMLCVLLGAEDEPVAYRILRNLLTFAPLFAFALGLSLGLGMSRRLSLKKKSSFDAFAATRPLEDAAFPRAVFRAAAASVLALWATLWALTFLCGGLLVLSGRDDAVGDALNDSRLGVAILGVAFPTDWRLLLHLGRCLVAGVAFMGIGAILDLDRRVNAATGILLIACIWFMAGVEMGYAPMAPWGWDIVGLSLLPWSAVRFAQAWRRGCLDARTVGVAFASWCLFAAVLGSFWLEVAPVRPHHVLLILGVSALPTTVLALGRTTLVQSRHQ